MRIIFVLIFLLCIFFSYSQVFSFFETEHSTTSLSLGGDIITKLDDVSLTYKTPSLLNQSHKNSIGFDYVNYSNQIQLFSFIYANEFKNFGMYNIGLKNMSYGNFQGFDINGFQTQEFQPNDIIFFTGLNKMIFKNITIGVNLELLNSNYEIYDAIAIVSNTSLSYNNIKKKIIISMSLNNFGKQIDSYTNNKDRIPLSLNFGISKSLKHLPFTYYLSIHDMQKFDISGPVQATQSYRNDETILKKMFYHVNIGGELNPLKKNFFLRFGFNFQKRYQMIIRNRPQLIGFSTGVGIKISQFTLDYAIISNHLSSFSNSFSLKMNLSNFVISGKKN